MDMQEMDKRSRLDPIDEHISEMLDFLAPVGRKRSAESIGFDLSHTKVLAVTLETVFRIPPFETNTQLT